MERKKSILIVEGRETVRGGQIITKEICHSLSDSYNVSLFLPGDGNSPVSLFLKDYKQIHYRLFKYTDGKKSFFDFVRFFKNLYGYRLLRRTLKENQIDLIYVQHVSMLPVVLLSCIAMNVCIVVHLHVFHVDAIVKRVVDFLLTSNKIKIILGVSEYTLSQLSSKLLTKCQVLYNPVHSSERIVRAGKSHRIAIIGDVVREKGHHILLEALSSHVNKYKVFAIGNIADEQYYHGLQKQFSKIDVEYTGMISDVPSFLKIQSINLVVVASTSPFETFSLAMVEAWSLGIPTIATDGFGMKELVEKFLPQYSHVMLFENGNYCDLMKKIDVLETDEKLYADMSDAVWQTVIINFSPSIFSDRLNRIINGLTGTIGDEGRYYS